MRLLLFFILFFIVYIIAIILNFKNKAFSIKVYTLCPISKDTYFEVDKDDSLKVLTDSNGIIKVDISNTKIYKSDVNKIKIKKYGNILKQTEIELYIKEIDLEFKEFTDN